MTDQIDRFPFRKVFSVAVLLPLLVGIPVMLWKLNLPIISSTSGSNYRVFEIFGFCVSVAITCWTVLHLRQKQNGGVNIPVVLFALLALFFVTQVMEYRHQSGDWFSYERAARAIVNGSNPYRETGYLYPPLTGLALASTHDLLVWAGSFSLTTQGSEFYWQAIFYLYQCFQVFLIFLAMELCRRLAKNLGASSLTSAILVALLFVFNVPLIRTLYFHQVNLWVLDLMLFAIVFLNAFPILAGVALGVALHIKLYAAILFFPLLLMRKYRVIAAMTISAIAIIAVQTNGGTNFELWQQYIALAGNFPAGTTFRDNSLHSIVFNTLAFANWGFLHLHHDIFENIVTVSLWLATTVVAMYFLWRAHKREQSFGERESAGTAGDWETKCRIYGHTFDAIALALIISPLVWEHHYILTLPIIIFAILTQGSQYPWRIGVAAFLICALPIFDFYPFSYHRIAGLALLLSALPPLIGKKQRWAAAGLKFA